MSNTEDQAETAYYEGYEHGELAAEQLAREFMLVQLGLPTHMLEAYDNLLSAKKGPPTEEPSYEKTTFGFLETPEHISTRRSRIEDVRNCIEGTCKCDERAK